jgi:hypothetical protein
MSKQQTTKKKHTPPGTWMGPPNSRGVRAGEIFLGFPTNRNNNTMPRPVHIGMLPNNIIRTINEFAESKHLSELISRARVSRSLKGLIHQLQRPNPNSKYIFYNGRYGTIIKNGDPNPFSRWNREKHSLINRLWLIANPMKALSLKSAKSAKNTKNKANTITNNAKRLQFYKQRANEASRMVMEQVKQNDVNFHKKYKTKYKTK